MFSHIRKFSDIFFYPFSKMLTASHLQFQQGNAPSHTAKSTWESPLDNGILEMNWPLCPRDTYVGKHVGIISEKCICTLLAF